MNKKFMGNFSLFMIMMSAFVGVFANDIYITQSGVTLDLAVTQDGDNNVMGTSGARVIVTGANATWTVSQVGDSNIISATILGATYTGTWAVTGSANDIAFLCSSGGTGKCESVDVDVTVNGGNADIDITIGANATSTNTDVALVLVGNHHTVDIDMDGNQASATTTIVSLTGAGGTATASDHNINFDYDKSGAGDSVGHKLTYTHVGSGTVDIIQAGTNDNLIDAHITSTGADVDITQTD